MHWNAGRSISVASSRVGTTRSLRCSSRASEMPADFYRLLRQAYAGDLVEPLLHYVDHTGLADAGERREFLQWVRHLLGRSVGPRWPLPIPEIERRMARFVKVMQAEWRRQH